MLTSITEENEGITVITITRNRPKLLERAISSVKRQTLHNVFHYIVIDDCPDTKKMLEEKYSGDNSISWLYESSTKGYKRGPERLAYLRNQAIHSIKTAWFSFLDDDNEFYPNHLELLLNFAVEENCSAVHSYREILYADGKPYLEDLSPWGRTIKQRAEKYDELVSEGVAERGSNIWHDKYGVTIDTNVWLLKTELFDEIEIPCQYSKSDWCNVVPEDMKLMMALMAHNVEVKTNKMPTVKYYLGGYSNDCGNTEGTVLWEE